MTKYAAQKDTFLGKKQRRFYLFLISIALSIIVIGLGIAAWADIFYNVDNAVTGLLLAVAGASILIWLYSKFGIMGLKGSKERKGFIYRLIIVLIIGILVQILLFLGFFNVLNPILGFLVTITAGACFGYFLFYTRFGEQK